MAKTKKRPAANGSAAKTNANGVSSKTNDAVNGAINGNGHSVTNGNGHSVTNGNGHAATNGNGHAASVATGSMPASTQLATERVLILGAALLLIGTLGFYHLPGMLILNDDEYDAQSKAGIRNRWIDSFYCAAITLTTVGFGDICPGETNFAGKIFLVLFSLSGLGIFCGPIMDLAATWTSLIPGGLPTLASFTVGLGVLVFGQIEGMAQSDAIYASVITGTTIGYGDTAPSSNLGKIAVALYAIASVNVMAAFLEPAKKVLEDFCRAKVKVD